MEQPPSAEAMAAVTARRRTRRRVEEFFMREGKSTAHTTHGFQCFCERAALRLHELCSTRDEQFAQGYL